MTLEEIKELIALMRKHRISEINLEQKGTKIHLVAEMTRQTASAVTASPPPMAGYYVQSPVDIPRPVQMPEVRTAAIESPKVEEPQAKAEETANTVEIKSPMVGTFYRAPAPDAPAYVDVGSVIHKDTVLCIIEAMKLLNEIKAETSGRVVKILVSNGQPVEYNQPLFLVEP